MVGSFFKVFLVTMALLVANSEALKCAVKGDSAEATEVSESMGPMEQLIGFKMNVKLQEECDGMCFSFVGSSGDDTGGFSGCQDFPPSQKKFAQFFANHFKRRGGKGGLYFVGCNWDNCNAVDHPNHAKFVNIQKTVKDQGATLDQHSDEPLKCHNNNGVSEACPGICANMINSTARGAWCKEDSNINELPYQALTIARAVQSGTSEITVIVGCSTNNCNADGSAGHQAMKNIQSKVEAELAAVQFVDITSNYLQTTTNRDKNTSHGFVLALVVSIILTTVDF